MCSGYSYLQRGCGVNEAPSVTGLCSADVIGLAYMKGDKRKLKTQD